MSFESDDISELTNEAEEIEKLFRKVENSVKVSPIKEIVKNAFAKQNNKNLTVELQSLKKKSAQEPSRVLSLKNLHNLHGKSLSSFDSGSFSDDIDEDELFNLLDKPLAKKKNTFTTPKPVSRSFRASRVPLTSTPLVQSFTSFEEEEKVDINKEEERVDINKAEIKNDKEEFEFDNEITDDDKEEEFGDYESYFRRKKLKQQKADENFLKWNIQQKEFMENHGEVSKTQISNIFKDCIIHVNGYTVPGINEIHKLVVLHGGTFLHYMSRKSAFTHVVASKLTPSKYKEFFEYKVVKPDWIVDSLKYGKLQDWKKYALIDKKEYGQAALPLIEKPSLVIQQGEKQNEYEKENDKENEDIVQDEEKPLLEDPLIEEELPLESDKLPIDSSKPNFLKAFFENSRLHHLSSWRTSFKSEFIIKSIQRYKDKFQGADMSNTMLFYIDFDCFFTSVSAMDYPDLDIYCTPICVSHGIQTSDVSSCNYYARKFGVKNGMWMTDAKKLCPNLVVLKYTFKNYEKVSRIFYNFLLEKNDDFICVLPISVDECIVQVNCDINDKRQFLNRAGKLKDQIKELTNCDISIGISNNRLLARLCLNHAKPNGIFFLNRDFEDYQSFLNNVLVKTLPGMGRTSIDKILENCFADKGKSAFNLTIGDLWENNITEAKLQETLGKANGIKVFNYINGKFDNFDKSGTASLMESLNYEYNEHIIKKESISIDVNWGIRFTTFPQVERFLKDLIAELVKRMAIYNKLGSTLTLKLMKKKPNTVTSKFLGMGICDLITKSSVIGLPTNNFGILYSEMRNLFQVVVGGMKLEDVRGIGVKVGKMVDNNNNNSLQKQLDFNKKKVKEVSFDLPSQYDKELFEVLPMDIQNEIKLQYKSEKIEKKMIERNNLGILNKVNKDNKMEIVDEVFSISDTSVNNSSFMTTQTIFFNDNPNIDQEIFQKEIPFSVQADIISNWKRQKFKFNNNDLEDFRRNLKLKKKKIKQGKILKKKLRLDYGNQRSFLKKHCFNAFNAYNPINNYEEFDNVEDLMKLSEFDYKHLLKDLRQKYFSGVPLKIFNMLWDYLDYLLEQNEFGKLGIFHKYLGTGRNFEEKVIKDTLEDEDMVKFNWESMVGYLKRHIQEIMDDKGVVL